MADQNQPLDQSSSSDHKPIHEEEWDVNMKEINPRKKREPKHQTVVKWLWRGTLAGLAAFILFIFVLSFQDLPTFEQLENPTSNLASEILGSNKEVIGRYFVENRVAVPFDSLSKNLVNALIATEDERFFEHSGIDWRAIARVGYGLVTLNPKGGGSTISQQLAKLLYSDRDFSGMNPIRKGFALATTKFKEWITAVKLEKSYTKEEIMAMYLNQFNFINGAYGIRAASEIYFGKPQNKLKIEEAALLIGMLQNPALHNPLKRPQNAQNRRNVVLAQMVKNGYLKEADFNKLKILPIKLNFTRITHADGLATYFRMELRKDIQTLLDKPEYRKADGSKYNIYKDGLKIYTSIDPVIQRNAEAASRAHMADLQKRFFTVWKGRDPWTDKAINIDAKVREQGLMRNIYESDRYQNIRSKYLDDVVQTIESEVDGLILEDQDIEYLMDNNAKGGVLTKLITDKGLSADKVSKLREVVQGSHWAKLKGNWNALQAGVQKEFRVPTKMRIFAYNNENEKDTIMSPIDSIKYLRMFLQMGSMAIDPVTGYVKSWIGGINHKYFQYDHVRTQRQVGSTFKPFVYATAISQQGISPCFQIPDLAYTIHAGEGSFGLLKNWTPSNSHGGYSGRALNLKQALKESVNSISVYLMKQLGDSGPVRGLVNALGIDSTRITSSPTICLGACDLSVLQMSGAYTAFANNGLFTKPMYLIKIEDKNGRVIYQNLPEERQALQPGANYVMVDMLKYVTAGAPGISGLKSDVGGKTGTTNDFVDGWFMGITPKLVVGTWVGGDDRWIRFLTLADGQGAKMARPFFARFLKALESDPKAHFDSSARFQKPPGDLGIEINCGEYNKPSSTPEEGDLFDNQFEN